MFDRFTVSRSGCHIGADKDVSSVAQDIANLPTHRFEHAFVATTIEGSLPDGIRFQIVEFRWRQVSNRAVDEVHAQDRRVRKSSTKLSLENGIRFATTAHKH